MGVGRESESSRSVSQFSAAGGAGSDSRVSIDTVLYGCITMRSNKGVSVLLLISGMLGINPPSASAAGLPAEWVITQPGRVTLSDGRDQGALVNLLVLNQRPGDSRYDFGYMDNGVFSSISTGRGKGKVRAQVFQAGTAVDFALRTRGEDGIIGTTDDSLFRISDAASHVTQRFSHPLRRWASGDDMLFSQLNLGWDTDQDGIRDLVVMLRLRQRHAGMHYTAISSPIPMAVPVPAALWLFGSGLAGLFAFGRRRRLH